MFGKTIPAIVAVLAIAFAIAVKPAAAASLSIEMYKVGVDGSEEKVGDVVVEESTYGLIFTPKLKNLLAGVHGMHVHSKPDCAPGPDAATGGIIAAGAAGGHYDPARTGKHSFPWDDTGHLGDLPALYVDDSGGATTPVLAPRLKRLDEIRGRSLMIHEGGENYSDHPKANGGGGSRLACGVIQ